MPDLFNYQIYCETEGEWVTQWAEEIITACPNNNTHTVTSGSVSVIDEQLMEGPTAEDGKPLVRSDSRPIGLYTYFTCKGDGVGIGDGTEMFWDFSNDDCTVSGAPAGYKKKRLVIEQNDPIWMKEGAIYFQNALKGSYADMMVVCPQGQYYYNRDGSVGYAFEDVVLIHYIRHHYFAGSCSMGDELNTEGCSDVPTPQNYITWCEVTVPEADNSSYGWASFEMYRPRTCLLPGESA